MRRVFLLSDLLEKWTRTSKNSKWFSTTSSQKQTILYAPIYIADWHKKNQNHSFGSDLHCRITCEDSKTFFTLPNCRSKVGRNLQLQIRQVEREEKRKRASYLLLDYSQDAIDKPLNPSLTPDHHYTSNESSKLSPLPKNKTNPINHQNTQLQLLLLFSPNTLTPLPPTSAPTRTPTNHHHHHNKHSQISTSSPPHSNFSESFSQRRRQQQEI